MARKPRVASHLPKGIRRFRASPSRLVKVNRTISKAQCERVQCENMDGLLKFACSRIPAEIASWLMDECFDPGSSQLVLPGRGRIALTPDCFRYFGATKQWGPS
ncbi:hypothetical protein BS78_K279400 [Paspalum vaginatum]|nr:hypothetical protein BS78_K279400 [Paspalum vaginatum]